MDYVERIVTEVEEKRDEFIFKTIYPFCEGVIEQKISKALLADALIEYRQNHPERFEEGEQDDNT